MPASPIRKLAPFASAAKAKGIHVYHLNIGQPDIKTPESMWAHLKAMDKTILEYAPSDGYASLKKQYVDYLNKSRHLKPIETPELLITTGGSEALLFTFMAIADEGDEIIVPEPMYANYVAFSHSAGVNIKALKCDFKNEFNLPSTESFEALISEKTKAILLCNPNNPTGYVYSDEELRRLAAIAKQHDLFLIVDEVYREFIYDDADHLSVLDIEDFEANAILVDSVSKRYSACGARIGALVSRNPAVIETALKFAQSRLSPPTLAQIGCEALFRVQSGYFDEVHDEYKGRRDLVVDELNKIEGVKCNKPRGAFYTIVQLPVEDSNHFCQWILESFSYEGATVMLAPGNGFYSTPNQGKNEVRLAYVLNKTDLTKAIECIKFALTAYKNR